MGSGGPWRCPRLQQVGSQLKPCAECPCFSQDTRQLPGSRVELGHGRKRSSLPSSSLNSRLPASLGWTQQCSSWVWVHWSPCHLRSSCSPSHAGARRLLELSICCARTPGQCSSTSGAGRRHRSRGLRIWARVGLPSSSHTRRCACGNMLLPTMRQDRTSSLSLLCTPFSLAIQPCAGCPQSEFCCGSVSWLDPGSPG